jgi:hypothetical protein
MWITVRMEIVEIAGKHQVEDDVKRILQKLPYRHELPDAIIEWNPASIHVEVED